MKDTINKVKKQPSEWEKAIANETTDTGLVSKIYLAAQFEKNEQPNQKVGKRPKQTFLQEDIQMASKHMKRCLTFLIIRELQIKTTMRYYLTQAGMVSIKKSTNNKCCRGYGEKGTLLTLLVENSVEIPQKPGTELPYNPAISLLGINPKETRNQKDTSTSMFIAALFTIAKTWKQPRCPLADERIRKL